MLTQQTSMLAHRRWPCLSLLFVLLAVAGHGTIARSDCIADLRIVTVLPGNSGPLQKIQIVRLHRWGADTERFQQPWLRQEATEVKECNFSIIESEIPARIDGPWLSGFLATNRNGMPDVYGNTLATRHSSVDSNGYRIQMLEYKIACDFLSNKWWASYAPDSGADPRICEFWLRCRDVAEVVCSSSTGWHREPGSATNAVWSSRWIWEFDGAAADLNVSTPWIVVGTSATWQEIGEYLADQMRQGNQKQTMTRAVIPVAQGGYSNRMVAAMRQFSNYHREPPTAGFRPKTLDQTLKDAAGNCKDLTRLLLNDLTAQQLPAYVVFRASSLSTMDDCIPCPFIFDHVLVAVPECNGAWFLDPYAGQWGFRPGTELQKTVETRENQLLVVWNPSASGTKLAKSPLIQ